MGEGEIWGINGRKRIWGINGRREDMRDKCGIISAERGKGEESEGKGAMWDNQDKTGNNLGTVPAGWNPKGGSVGAVGVPC